MFADFCRKHRGSISLLLAIMLLPSLTLVGVVFDAANLSLSRSVAESAGELTVNAALANYDTVLEEVYGLFAISQDEADLTENLKGYFENTLRANGLLDDGESGYASATMQQLESLLDALLGGISTDDINTNFLNISATGFRAEGVPESALSRAPVLKNQIIEFMKYRGPAEIGLDLLNSLNAFRTLGAKAKLTEAKMDTDEAIGDLAELAGQFYEAIDYYDEMVGLYKNAEQSFFARLPELENQLSEAEERIQFLASNPLEMKDVNYVKREEIEVPLLDAAGNPLMDSNNDPMVATEESFHISGGPNLSSFYTTITEVETDLEDGFEVLREMYDILNNAKSGLGTLGASWSRAFISLMQTFMLYMRSLEYTHQSAAVLRNKFSVADSPYYARLEEFLRNSYALQGDYQDQASNYTAAVKALEEEIDSRLGSVIVAVKDYYGAVYDLIHGKVPRSVREFRLLSPNSWGSITFLEYAESLGEKVKDAIANVAKKNDAMKSAVVAYNTKNDADDFSGTISGEAERNEQTFSTDDVEAVISQLRATKIYLAGTDGVLARIQGYLFYGKALYTEDNNGVALRKFAILKAESGGAASLPALSPNTAKAYTITSYAKEVGKVLDSPSVGVPPYYYFLVRTYGGGGTADETKSNNLQDSGKNMQEEANKTLDSAGELSYADDVFSPLSLPDDGSKDTEKATKIESGKTGIIKQMKSMATLVNNIFAVLTGGLENARDSLMVTEYIMQNFSYATMTAETEKANEGKAENKKSTPKTMTNQPISEEENVIYGCEAEYMLYGLRGSNGHSPQESVKLVKQNIFAIRFMANCIFALTDGEVDAITLPPAIAIQSATLGVFPYQIAQVVFKLCLALAESAVDVDTLMKGEKVVLLKSKGTWTLLPSGAIAALKSKALEAVSEFATRGIETLTGKLQEAISGTAQWASDEISGVIDGAKKDVQSTFEAALNEVASGLTQVASNYIQEALGGWATRLPSAPSISAQDVRLALAQMLTQYVDAMNVDERIKTFIRGKIDMIVDRFMTAHVESPINPGTTVSLVDCLGKMEAAAETLDINQIYQEVMQCISAAIDSVQSLLAEEFEDFAGELSQEAKSVVDNVLSESSGYLQEVVGDAAETAKELTQEGIEKLNQGLDSAISAYFPDNTAFRFGDEAGQPAESGFALKFSYKDYLRLFVFLNLAEDSSATPVIERIGEVITLNVVSGLKSYYESTGIQAPAAGYAMGKAYTYISIESTIEVRPILLSREFFTQGGQIEAFDMWQYSYHGAGGY